MFARSGLTALIFFAPLIAAPTGDHVPPILRTQTTFGHVSVDQANAAAAIAEGEAAHLAARTVLALPDVRFDIAEVSSTAAVWGSLTPEGLPLYVWAFRKHPDTQMMPPPAYLLRHEIGHDLFIRYLIPSTTDAQYGGDAPDWLDEMAAIAFESDTLRTARRRAAVDHAKDGKLIPLGRFLKMQHPEYTAGPIPAASGAAFPLRDPASAESAQFYSTASSFYDYLVARTGHSAIIAELATAFRKGEPLDRWILKRTGFAGKARGIAALDADFLKRMASDPRYGAGAAR